MSSSSASPLLVRGGAAALPALPTVDVVIVGAGISGICAAAHLQLHCPHLSFVILEGRDNLGGTWDLFKYPGIRSDSDMHTLGFSFFPWHSEKGIAAGPDIMSYLRETVAHFQLGQKIRLRHRVAAADFDSATSRWNLRVASSTAAVQQGGAEGGAEVHEEFATLQCQFMHMCTGYYQYDEGYTPDFPGASDFRGKLMHPQQWDTEYDYTGQRVVVIGSGATAVTIVPEIAKTAGHVVMLQRSPTYMAYVPSTETSIFHNNRFLPTTVSTFLTRWQKIGFQSFVFWLAGRFPKLVRKFLLKDLRAKLPNYTDEEFKKHFHPYYEPWSQRLCAVTDGDLFKSLRHGTASVVTDRINHFTETGIALESGTHVDADIIITATGLVLQKNFPMSTVRLTIDGRAYRSSETMIYRGMMCEGVPNLIFTMGYAAASWTLRAEATCAYWVRLLNHMHKKGLSSFCPFPNDVEPDQEATAMPLTSGYVQRAKEYFPKQGEKAPWRAHNHFVVDWFLARTASLDDGYLTYERDGAPCARL